jgi:phosphatidylserine/phosphatidylglycerophosphate/cardiolipin synthase-like enzyme
VKAAILGLALGIALPAFAEGHADPRRAAHGSARIEAYFTPGDDVAGVISERISTARRTVHVQAYLFTNRRIAAALSRAARRGVAVELIGDAKQHESGGLPVLKELDRAGVRIWLHGDYAAFHNKVVLVDASGSSPVVITGSYNFTQSAQDRNAENVVVIAGDSRVASRFLGDFERHRARASRLQ